MPLTTLSVSRRHVLGTYHDRCEAIEYLPVFLSERPEDPIGYVDQTLGKYVDAFSFHLPPDICDDLSGGRFSYSFQYEKSQIESSENIKINSIHLTRLVRLPSLPAAK